MKLTIACSKGGCCKTTTTLMLATAMADAGLRVQVWDADPQGSATSWHAFAAEVDEPFPFDVQPVNRPALKRPVPPEIDYVLIDTNPYEPAIAQAAIDTADYVIVPTNPSPRDMERVWSTLETIPHRPHRVLVCRADRQTIAFRETIEVLDTFDAPRFETVIPQRTRLGSAGGRPAELYGYDAVLSEILRDLEHSA